MFISEAPTEPVNCSKVTLNPSRVSRGAAARCTPPSCVMFAFLIKACAWDYGRLGFKAADLVVTAVN